MENPHGQYRHCPHDREPGAKPRVRGSSFGSLRGSLHGAGSLASLRRMPQVPRSARSFGAAA